MLFCDVGVTVQSLRQEGVLRPGVQGGWTFSDPNFPPKAGSQEKQKQVALCSAGDHRTRPPPPIYPLPRRGSLVVPGGAPMGTGVCPTLCQEKSAGLPSWPKHHPSVCKLDLDVTWRAFLLVLASVH